jgi:hypothetical protein
MGLGVPPTEARIALMEVPEGVPVFMLFMGLPLFQFFPRFWLGAVALQ